MVAALNRHRLAVAIVAGSVVTVVLLGAGAVWLAFYVADNIGAPGPGATGSGPCTSADSVNVEMAFADGHTVHACTRDRPSCPNHTVTVGGPNTTSISQLTLSNQLRSSSRRYILFIRTEFAVPSTAGEQTLRLDPSFEMPGPVSGPPDAGTGPRAEVQITPRDPQVDGAMPQSGTLTLSSSHGVVQGRIDGTFNLGPFRSDRPQPSPFWSPAKITGTFTCNE